MDNIEFDRQIYCAMQIPDENKERRVLVLEVLALLYGGPPVARKQLKDFVAKNPAQYRMKDRDIYETKMVDILIVMPLKHLKIIVRSIQSGLDEANRQVALFYDVDTKGYKDI